MPVPTWRLAAAAAFGSVVVLLLPLPPPIGLVVVDGGLLAGAIADWLLATRPADLEVRRELPGVVPLGNEARIVWTVARPRGRRPGPGPAEPGVGAAAPAGWRVGRTRPARVWLADELAPSLAATTRRARLVVPARGRVSAATTIRPRRRGRFTPTELTVRVEGPLGLAARQGRRQLPGILRVYPPFHSRNEAELRINKARILEVGLRSAQGRGGGTEFDSLREYSIDDEFRRVDWAATARMRKPIVRTYRAERNQTVLLLLDAGRTMAGVVQGVPRLDHAMDAVMMLTAVATRLGDRAGLVAFDSDVRAVVGAGHARDQLGRVTEAMYALEPKLVESDYRAAFATTLARFRRRTMLVVFTELAEQAMTETLLPALPLIARDHLVVVASVATWPTPTSGSRQPGGCDPGRWSSASASTAITSHCRTPAKRAVRASPPLPSSTSRRRPPRRGHQ